MYYYVYVLKSEIDDLWYTGYTADLKNRLLLHNEGKVESTKNRRPLKLIYFEGCLEKFILKVGCAIILILRGKKREGKKGSVGNVTL
jgi:hypothetical protein